MATSDAQRTAEVPHWLWPGAEADDESAAQPARGALLAVDLGLRCGLALYARTGRLLWYRSTHFGSRAQLSRGVRGLFASLPTLEAVALEGDRRLGEVWARAARKRGVEVMWVAAERWRERLFHPRERRSGTGAKRSAQALARATIAWSGARRPTSLRHDAAEAILIGLWAVLERGWLARCPDLRH